MGYWLALVYILIPTAAVAGPGLPLIAAAIIKAVVATVISTGISLIARSLFKKDEPIQGPNLSPVRQVVRQATPFQRYIYGRALVGGAMCYIEKSPPYLYVSYLVAAHACEEIESVEVNGFEVLFNSAGESVNTPFRRNGVPYLKISSRLGDPDQAIDPILSAAFPSLDTNFRQRGQTVVTVRAFYGTDFDDHENVWGPTQDFNPLFTVKGRKVYDPRDPAQDRDDETTWKWSDNWALCNADWIRAPFGGRKKATQIDYVAVAEEADRCDQAIGKTDGTAEPRYTMNGAFQADQSPFTILDSQLNAAGDAMVLWRRGEYQPLVDVPRTAVRTLTQADMTGTFTYRSSRSRHDVLNTVRSEFVYPARGYKAAITPPLIDAALVTADSQPLEATIRRPFTAGEERAQRLDKIALRRSRLGKEVTISVGIQHMDLEVGDNVNLEFEDFDFVDGVYTIVESKFDGQLQENELTLFETPPLSLYEWSLNEVQDTSLTQILSEV